MVCNDKAVGKRGRTDLREIEISLKVIDLAKTITMMGREYRIIYLPLLLYNFTFHIIRTK